MKRLTLILVALLAGAASFSALAQLDATETDDLRFMREEEKLARDTYLTLYERWSHTIFRNIARSEQRHMDTMLSMIEYYGLADPVTDDTVGVFNDTALAALYGDLIDRGSISLLEALHVGAYIEELDIGDLRATIDRTDEVLLINAYENLLAGSRNHLRAFVSQITALGVDYVAQVLDQADVDAIVDGYDLPANAGFTINAGLNDAWYDPATSGQGFFITVYPGVKTVFLGWFTYDTEQPDASVTAQLGSPDQRWLTAQGVYDGAQAEMEVRVFGGGVFDAGTPVPEGVVDGSILLQFENCNSATVTYDIPSIGRTGVIPIERIALDNVPHCEKLAEPDGGP
ncbi:MAG: DUF2202 domain-containing protein [Xanthomonadales bacterium]